MCASAEMRLEVETSSRRRDDWQVTAERQRLIAEALGRKPETILEIDVGYDFEVASTTGCSDFHVGPASRKRSSSRPCCCQRLLPRSRYSYHRSNTSPTIRSSSATASSAEPLVDEDGEGVRAFLDALHAFDTSGLPVAAEDWVEAYRNQCAEFERLVFPGSTATGAPEQGGSSGTSRGSRGSNPPSSTPILVLSTCSYETAVSSA
jgi:hypothetical protein